MPKTSAFQRESELQKLLWQAIQDDALSECIVEHEDLLSFDETAAQDSAFPQFSIDHLARRACLRAGNLVLKSLSLLKPLTGDKNVSFAAGEIMRPDIVCINPDQESVVIFELKKAAQTGRQALTELLAYEHEIKNLLPFLSNYDVRLVLVSPEWSPLMDHAVAAAVTWSGRQILCLHADLVDGRLRMAPRIPPAWTITGSVYFPEAALPSVTLCLYEKDAYSPENVARGEIEKEGELDPRIWTALEVIAREGDRMGAHGFALLWRDHLGTSLTSYNLTIVGVAPFPFYAESRRKGNIATDANELVRQLDQYLLDHDPQGYADSLMDVAKAAFPLLKEVADPQFEGFSTWRADQPTLRRRAEPLLCEFWGELGAYARAFVLHPAIRKHRRSLLRNGFGDWRQPEIGLPLIASFTEPDIFGDGDVRCMDAFRLGVMLGLDRLARIAMRDGIENKSLACLFKWNLVELMPAIDEVRMLANAAENVEAPEAPFRFYDDPLLDDDEDAKNFMDWLPKEFLQESIFHIRALKVGFSGALFFDGERSHGVHPADPTTVERIAESVRRTTRQTLEFYRALEKEQELPRHVGRAFDTLLRLLGLRRNFAWRKFEDLPSDVLVRAFTSTLQAMDAVTPAVFHKHRPIAPSRPDWRWLKQGIAEMRKRDIADAGVILLPNGRLVTGPVLPEEMKFPLTIDHPEQQVPYLDRSNGFGVVRVMTWSELMALFENGSSDH